jgi:23S rRNA (uridine2552-2'-O)-methyltransferase
MAPEVSGDWDLDQYRQIYLARVVLVIASKLLKDEGWIVVKAFQGSEHEKFIQETKDMFKMVKIVKPKASRKKSAEIYVVAKGLRLDRVLPKDFRENEKERF